jgi:hypothetical protein
MEQNSFFMKKRIGTTTFEVHAFFNPDATETLDEKIIKLIENDLTYQPQYDIMESPQTSRLSGGGNT